MNRNGRKRILLVACALAAVCGLSLEQNPAAAQFPSYTPPPMHTFNTPSFGGRSYSPPAMSRPTIGPRQYPSGPPFERRTTCERRKRPHGNTWSVSSN